MKKTKYKDEGEYEICEICGAKMPFGKKLHIPLCSLYLKEREKHDDGAKRTDRPDG